jgi:hypothetical protein
MMAAVPDKAMFSFEQLLMRIMLITASFFQGMLWQ